jgi:hypothetical protein
MLIEFSVKNFKSFNKKVTFSMVASPDTEHPENLIKTKNGFNLLKTAVIYGGNASGKSNFIEAMAFLKNQVLNSATKTTAGQKFDVKAFAFAKANSKKPTEMEISFIQKDIIYTYGFEFDKNRIQKEWLYTFPKKHKRVAFERTWDKLKSNYKYDFKSGWQGEKLSLAKRTRDNALFLSVASQWNNEFAESLVSWFSKDLMSFELGDHSGLLRQTFDLLSKNKSLKKDLVEWINEIDSSIVDFSIEKHSGNLDKKENLNIETEKTGRPFVTFSTKGSVEFLFVDVLYKSENQKDSVAINLFDESLGTRKFLSLAPPIFKALYSKSGKSLVIDEFESSLHPLLASWIIRYFQSKKQNKGKAQLIITTHSDSLLDQDLFRRDQVWLIEKGKDHASDMYSLYDFKEKPRKGENLRKGYLAGRYGGIPFINDI